MYSNWYFCQHKCWRILAVTTKVCSCCILLELFDVVLEVAMGFADQRGPDKVGWKIYRNTLGKVNFVGMTRLIVKGEGMYRIRMICFIRSFGTLVTDPDLSGARFSTTELWQQFSPPKRLICTKQVIFFKTSTCFGEFRRCKTLV